MRSLMLVSFLPGPSFKPILPAEPTGRQPASSPRILIAGWPGWSAGVLQPGRDAVDGQQQEPVQGSPLLFVLAAADLGERAQLQVRERVHIGISQRYRPGQHLPAR